VCCRVRSGKPQIFIIFNLTTPMKTSNKLLIALGLVAFAIIIRLVPHLPNATPLAAVALISSTRLGKKYAIILPLGALFLSDTLIGFYDWRIMASVYGSYAIIGAVSWLAQKYRGAFSIGSLSLASSTLFFIITNTAVWAFSPWYAKSFAGIAHCFTLALPFFGYMAVGDLLYTTTLFTTFATAEKLLNTRTTHSSDDIEVTPLVV